MNKNFIRSMLIVVLVAACLTGQQRVPQGAAARPVAGSGLEQAVSAFIARDYIKAGPQLSDLANRGNVFAAWLLTWRFNEIYPAVQQCDPMSLQLKLAKVLADAGLKAGLGTLAMCSDPSPYFTVSPRAVQNAQEAAKWRRMMRDAKLTTGARANLDQGFVLLRKHAEAGNAFAQLSCHELATDTAIVSHDVADSWLRKAADQGLPEAEFRLAQHFRLGQGAVNKDLILWLSWTRKAADHGYAPAQLDLASTFQYGFKVTANLAESRRLYQSAAQNKTAAPNDRALAQKALKEMDSPSKPDTETSKAAKTPNKTDALLAAVETGDVAKVEAQIAGGARINSTASAFPGRTALQLAASKGDVAMVQYLVGHGAEVKVQDNYGGTVLHAVAGDPELVQYLVTKGAEPNSKDNNGNSPLHLIVYPWGDVKHVEFANALISAKADVNAKNDNGETPIVTVLKAEADCSISFNLGAALPIIDALLRARADPSIADKDGNNALSLTQNIRKNCSRYGDSVEQIAASRVVVSTLTRMMSRAPSPK